MKIVANPNVIDFKDTYLNKGANLNFKNGFLAFAVDDPYCAGDAENKQCAVYNTGKT